MKDDWQFSLKRWRDGSWAVAAMRNGAASGTLIESDGKAAARIVISNSDRSVEVTAQPVLYSKGLGRAVISAAMNQDGSRVLKAHRVFPNGAVRIDEVRRRGSQGERHSVWSYANGSRIVARATQVSQHVEMFDRQARLTGSRMTQITQRSTGQITFHTNVSDATGKAVGRLLGTAQLFGGRKMRIMSGEGPAVPSRSEVRAVKSSTDMPAYNDVVKNKDGSVTATSRQSDGKTTYSTETTFNEVGQPMQTVQTVTQSGEAGSNTTTTTVTMNTSDGHTIVTSAMYGDGPGGTWNGTWDTTVDGQVTARGAHSEDGNGNSSDTRVDYLPDGGGVITTTSTDSDGNTTTTSTGFDKDGNPWDPSGGAPSGGAGGGGTDTGGSSGTPSGGGSGTEPGGGGGTPSGGGGGGDDPNSGGDNGGNPPEPSGGGDNGGMPSDCGTDEGPRIGGKLNGSGGLSALGTLGDLGWGAGGDGGDGGDPGTEYDGVYQDLIGEIGNGGLPSGGSRGDGGWGEGGGSEGPPTVQFSGSRGAMIGLGGHVPTDDWGDWNDPRVLVAFAATAFGVSVGGGVNRAINGVNSIKG